MSCKLLNQIDQDVYECLNGQNDPYEDDFCYDYQDSKEENDVPSE